MRDLLRAQALLAVVGASAVPALGLVACAAPAAQKQAAVQEEAPPPPKQESVSPEKLEELDAYFKRKTGQLQYRCYNEEVERTKVKYQGAVSVSVVVIPGGKARDVKIISSSLNAAGIEKCILGEMGSWDWPDVPSPAPYVAVINFKPAW